MAQRQTEHDEQPDLLTQERVARNDETFRAANERIRRRAGAAEVIADRGSYVVVRKTGHAGEVAERLDPRTHDE